MSIRRRNDRSAGLSTRAIAIIAGCVVIALVVTDITAKTVLTITQHDFSSTLSIGRQLIFDGSDSLYLNGELLQRRIDYDFDPAGGKLDLHSIDLGLADTLLVTFDPVPSWLQRSFGNIPPEPGQRILSPAVVGGNVGSRSLRRMPGDLSISGAKTFRISTRSSTGSNFGQSLDLKISGHLTPEIEIQGAVSDRGYDPAYGSINSRLSELDKIRIQLKSTKFLARLGNIDLPPRRGTVGVNNKEVSGASLDLNLGTVYLNGAAARPKGRFESIRFQGEDGRQGPYRISIGESSRSVVPGSEVVWLDGQVLERGANKDYILEYAAGQVTFNVNHAIDSRSRIEIDFEPLLTSYQGELFYAGGGAAAADSSLFLDLRWLREGDDVGRPLAGLLSDNELRRLQLSGDNSDLAVRSGVAADTAGAYILVIDSLPDSVWKFVGAGYGDHSVRFSFVGNGGDYRFLGGNQYQFAGRGRGDYLPVLPIALPERIDQIRARFGLSSDIIGKFTAGFEIVEHDRNLLSSLDDNDNEAILLSFRNEKQWRSFDRSNSITIHGRFRDFRFRARERLNVSDFRRMFLFPEGYTPDGNETLIETKSLFSPTNFADVELAFSGLDYRDRFRSYTGMFRTSVNVTRSIKLSESLETIKAGLDTSAVESDGKGTIIVSRLTVGSPESKQLSLKHEYDIRTNSYFYQRHGTRYHQYDLSLTSYLGTISIQHFLEDSLDTGWERSLKRSRLSARTNQRQGRLAYHGTVTYQWLDSKTVSDRSFLGRLTYNYKNLASRLNLSGFYALSEEFRNQRGITYLEVENGQGDFILEDSQFVPDANGNYLKVEEILSEKAQVRRAEKSFQFDKQYRQILVRFSARIEEELLPEGERSPLWLIPFYSDNNQAYLFYSRRYTADIRMFPAEAVHLINIALNQDIESRTIGSLRRDRKDDRFSLTLKQVSGASNFEQTVELFRLDRDSYFNGSGSVDGYRISLGLRQLYHSSEYSVSGAVRRAADEADRRSTNYQLTLGSRLRILRRGELRSSVELYSQRLKGTSTASYTLTDNRPGSRGLLWSVGGNYGVRGGLRVNLSISGRHSDKRTPRIAARGEMVAGF